MSRLIIKNLPKMVNNQQIIDHFSEAGMVTDVKLKYKKNGEFRGYGFVGFESEEITQKAAAHFQNSYFKQNKLSVEICHELDHKLKSDQKKKKESEEKVRSSQSQQKQFKEAVKRKEEMTKEKLTDLMQNPNFVHYLTLNQKGTSDLVNVLKKKYVIKPKNVEEEEDEGIEEESEEEKEEEEEEETNKVANQNVSDLEYLQSLMKSSNDTTVKGPEKKKKWEDLWTVVIRTKEQHTDKEKKGKTLTKKGVKAFLQPLKCRSLRIPRGVTFVAYVGFKTEKDAKQAMLKDKSFLDGVRVRVHKYEKKSGDGDDLSGGSAPWKAAEEKLLKEAEPVAESGRLFVRNLWYSATEEDVKNLFQKFGPLADVTLPLSKLTRRPKGFAHVTFVFPEHAVKAENGLDGTSFQGRILHILPSLVKEEDQDTEGKSFKDRRKAELKKSASSWHNWNSLFLGSGAVIDLMATNFATSKQQLFEAEGEQSAAVNLALGETQLVDETKRFLEEEGVSLSAFTDPSVQRSSCVMLAKNLSAKTSAQELREVFGRHGEIGRLLLPPSGVTAIIEFLDPGEAKRAYRELAYSKFKYLPLYLEWAPMQVFSGPPPKRDPNVEKSAAAAKAPDSDTTLYVKNLNFNTEEEAIHQHFSSIGEVHSVLISKRRGLSQGYGFVQFVKAADAKTALRQLQNSPLDGHNLYLKPSEKKLTTSVPNARKIGTPGEPSSAKMLVKNIPFQATNTEVRQLFKTFGELKSVRLPSKPGSSEHRGFGFVEFITKEDAKKAYDALGASTHLYGRRLVLEWAHEEESVEELRRKTAEHYLGSGPPNKKQKIELPGKQTDQFDIP